MLTVVTLSLLVGACGSTEDPNGEVIPASSDNARVESADFRLILGGSATDTLSGDATYGHVINPRTDRIQLVIKLEVGVDFVGGVFIARGDSLLPEERTYDLVNTEEAHPDSVPSGAFFVVYQEGLLRQLTSRDGTVSFSHVSDTLISGTLEATLRGHVGTGRGGQIRPGEIRMNGRFDAQRGIVGFIVGL